MFKVEMSDMFKVYSLILRSKGCSITPLFLCGVEITRSNQALLKIGNTMDIYIYIYIYMYVKRERERGGERGRGREGGGERGKEGEREGEREGKRERDREIITLYGMEARVAYAINALLLTIARAPKLSMVE